MIERRYTDRGKFKPVADVDEGCCHHKCPYLVSRQLVWWCLWGFCSWSCHLHTLRTCPPALRSQPPHRSPFSVQEDTCRCDHGQVSCSLSRTHVAPLTSHSPSTHTLYGSLYEQRVPSRTVFCMETTPCVSLDWQCSWQRLLARIQTQTQIKTDTIMQMFVI